MFEETRAGHFPAELVPGVTAHSVGEETIRDVLERISDRVFSPLASLGNYEMPDERRGRSAYLREVHEATHRENVVFYVGEEPVGWSIGSMLDPGTFFMAYSGVLPGYRRRGIYLAFLGVFLAYLRELGYERVTSNHAANNRAILIAKLKAGFYVSGAILDERFGAQVGLVYLFHEDRRRGFARAFGLEE